MYLLSRMAIMPYGPRWVTFCLQAKESALLHLQRESDTLKARAAELEVRVAGLEEAEEQLKLARLQDTMLHSQAVQTLQRTIDELKHELQKASFDSFDQEAEEEREKIVVVQRELAVRLSTEQSRADRLR